MAILHLTDLHLDNNFGKREALRAGYFREYLFPVITRAKEHKVSKIFITGDIVNKYNVQSYPVALEIIEHFCQELELSKTDIFVTNGNHDVNYETGKREAYDSFIAEVDSEKKLVIEGERFKSFSHNNDLIVCLDSIGDNYKSGEPRCIDDIADDIVGVVTKQTYDNLYVLSHHPVLSKDIADGIMVEEPGWHEKHQWASGGALLKRFCNPAVTNCKVFWFAGDVHVPEHCVIDDKIVHLTTGSLNFVTELKDGKSLPQARIFNSSCIQESIVYSFHPSNFSGKNHLGEWKSERICAINQNRGDKGNVSSTEELLENKENAESLTINPQFKLLDSKLDEEITKTVSENKLSTFGNAVERNGVSSLSWISITSLFQEHELYIKVIQQFNKKINELVKQSSNDECDFLLVGVDNWGAIMASRLGAATNISSCSIATGDSDRTHIEEEVVNAELQKIVSNKSELIVITDVISTGQTIARIVEELNIPDGKKQHVLSVFFDNNQEHKFDSKQFQSSFSACLSTRIPLIDSSRVL